MKDAIPYLLRPDVFPWVGLYLGLVFGSFLNVVIYRVPFILRGERPIRYLASPGSSCPVCGHNIRWFENIPVLSYLVLRGRCASCRTCIPGRYLFVEALHGGLWWLAALLFGASFFTIFCWAIVSAWIALPFLRNDIRLAFAGWFCDNNPKL